MSVTGVSVLALAALLMVPLMAGEALAASTKDACADASEQAQELRSQGRLRSARDRFAACARSECPRIVREACDRWLGETEASLPTLVIRARDAEGQDRTAVRVTLDGAPLVDKLEGRPIAVDPGTHVLGFESEGLAPLQQQVVIAEGEKNRVLTVTLGPPAGAAVALSSVGPMPAHPSDENRRSSTGAVSAADDVTRPVPTLVFVLAGTSLVAFGASTDLVLLARSNETTMRSTCAPRCSAGEYDAFNHKVIAADVALGVGIVAATATAWLFFQRPSHSGSPLGLLWIGGQPERGGFQSAFGGWF